jgi:hypothetical protein
LLLRHLRISHKQHLVNLLLHDRRGNQKIDNPDKLATYNRVHKTKKNTTIFVEHHYAQAYTNNVNITQATLETTGGKDEPNIVFLCRNRNGQQNTELRT